MDGVLCTPLRRITSVGGDVFHGMKATDPGFSGFGEAYFSFVEPGQVKGWKRHREMVLNFVVPAGAIQVTVLDETSGSTDSWILGPRADSTYVRLTIRQGLWVAFGGVGRDTNMLVNVASIPHDPSESAVAPLATFPWSWVTDRE